ncbi:MAG: signal recognition particle-docking protein FtsY [Candidatus Dadabacteria bacterium]|nr:signal recognition particle-docking protein FtsY [Candidatus Dadabacteria bacterium]MCZ6864391.1 signal recognition particle-docking protein FtsY [Candidatus Dadabacteria bacterium]
MEVILSMLNSIPSPYSDFVAVAVIFVLIAVISFIIAFLVERKAQKQAQELEIEEDVKPPAETQEVIEDLDVAGDLEAVNEPIEEVPDIQGPELQTQTTQLSEELLETEPPPQEIYEEEEIKTEEIEEEPEVLIEPIGEVEETKEGLFARLRRGLSKTQAGLLGRLGEIISKREIDESLWDDFEETLIMSDLGVNTTMKLRENIETKLSKQSLSSAESITDTLKEEILEILKSAQGAPIKADVSPFVIMVAGVNGVGKTTTIGKLANMLKQDGRKVMVAAADTFRAAATEQLEVWSKRVGTDFIKGESGGDPSSVAFDAIKAAEARGTDILIIDTAGRLHTKGNLMDELTKMKRIIRRELEGAPHETLLVLDATTGQNAVQQAKLFNEAIEVTGIVLTKLDGTAKGGVIVAIADELNIPVKYIGIGESLSDLREFNADEFVEALFYSGEEIVH